MISGHAPPSIDGVSDYTAALLDEMARQRPDWRWTWLSRRPRWFHSPVVLRQGYTLLRPTHTWNGRGPSLAIAALRALKPDLVHIQEQIHTYFETDAAERLAEAAGCPVVTTLHEYHVERPSAVHTTALLRRSTRIIANDSRNADRCRTEAGRQPDACWWSGSNVPPPEPSWKVEPVPGLVTTFGFISSLKALNLVHEAVAILRTTGRTETRWRLVGPFQPDTNAIHADLAREMSEDWVEFTGGFASVRDRKPRTLLAESSVMALPFVDGASMRRSTLQAAWALGIPVVTTPPPVDEPEIVDGVNCLLVREPSAEAWAAAIRRILEDPSLAETLRRGSLATAKRHDWSELSRRHLDLYDSTLNAALLNAEPTAPVLLADVSGAPLEP